MLPIGLVAVGAAAALVRFVGFSKAFAAAAGPLAPPVGRLPGSPGASLMRGCSANAKETEVGVAGSPGPAVA
ncbi:hypothetical protein ABFA25_10395 [Mycobacterium lepromatosis]|uniref:hypothetical protein n=1 Tax=Mycobacterium lepromatosis TaxID=480418 RepID=UPI0026BD4274